MIEVTFRIESLDYTDKLDSQLPLVLEALSQSGNINPVLKLACNTPEASSRIVKGILRTMSQDQKQRLATKIVNANREKLMRGLLIACAKRPITPEKIDGLITSIETELRSSQRNEIKSRDLGDLVLARLATLDDVAYIRFASVYKDFQNVEEFSEALKELG